MLSDLKLTTNNLVELARVENPKLTQLAFDSARLPDPILFPRVVDELGLYDSSRDAEIPTKVSYFYHSYTHCQRNVISKLQGYVGKDVPPARIRAVQRLFTVTSQRGSDARGSLRQFLGLSPTTVTAERRRDQDERRYWLDDPGNVTKFVWALALVYVLLLLADALVEKHGAFAIEDVFGFYALFGFIAYVALIFLGKGLRALVMRPEDYYERDYRRADPAPPRD
jgi:hypothetical protein